jgi:hypothetical protein
MNRLTCAAVAFQLNDQPNYAAMAAGLLPGHSIDNAGVEIRNPMIAADTRAISCCVGDALR